MALFVLDHQTGLTGTPTASASPPLAPRHSLRRRLAIPSAALLLGATAAAATIFVLLRPTPQSVTRLPVSASSDAAVAVDDQSRSIAVSPDGRKIAYTSASTAVYRGADARLFVRALDQLAPTLVAGPGSVREPFFSPDGEWIGFFGPAATTQLQKVSAAGGPPVPLAAVDGASRGATWGPDDTIIFATQNSATGLQRISANGGEQTVLTRPNREKGEREHLWPHFLPGGQAVLFTIVTTDPVANALIAVLDLRDGSQKIVLRGGSDARYLPGGYLVYGVAGTLRAVAFDLDRLEVRGTPATVLQQVVTTFTLGSSAAGAANFAVGANGTLTYVSGSLETIIPRTLVWIDRQGHEELVGVPPRAYIYPRLSPDGTRIALEVRDQQNDIWIWDLARQTMSRLTFDPGIDREPTWTPDGRRLAFSPGGKTPQQLYWQAADGTGAAESITKSDDSVGRWPSSFSPDGTRLLFNERPSPPFDVGMVTLDGARRTELLLKGPYSELNAEVSSDGRWLAYQSNESGSDEIYVRPFPNVDGGKWQVSTGGGTRPHWARDGRELFYFVQARGVLAAPIRPGTTFTAGTAKVVVSGAAFFTPNAGRTYDVSPDGRRFLMIKEVPQAREGAAALQLVVVENWTEELKRLVPTR